MPSPSDHPIFRLLEIMARLRAPEDVAPGQEVGDRLRLDRRGGGIAFCGEGAADRLDEPKVCKLHGHFPILGGHAHQKGYGGKAETGRSMRYNWALEFDQKVAGGRSS